MDRNVNGNTSIPEILYEDKWIIVCKKPHGVPTQSKDFRTPDMESILKHHIYKNASVTDGQKKSAPYLAVIHRLDQPVSGLLVFAKTPAAAKELNRQLTQNGFGKYYRALVQGTPSPEEGTLEDYLVKDGRTNTSRVCSKDTPGAKLAKLQYRVTAKEPCTCLDIHLSTGRHHQIRVQLAHMGCPIIGDTKYNPNASQPGAYQELKLTAYKLTFIHPNTKKEMQFELPED